MGAITTFPAQAPVIPVTGTTLGYAEVTANQAGITTETDLTGLSVTITVPEGRRIRISGKIAVNGSAASSTPNLRIKEGSTVLIDSQWQNSLTAGFGMTLPISVVISPSAGMHTYKLALVLAAGSGSLTMVAGAVTPAFILVEDITSMPQPYPLAAVPVGQLAYAFNTADQSSGTALTDITGCSVNVVVPAGRVLRITGHFALYNRHTSTNNLLVGHIREGSTTLNVAYASHPNTTGIAGDTNEGDGSVIVSPSAGSHTYKLSMACSNTGMIALGRPGGSGDFCWIDVEDITPTPVPANTAPSSTLGYAEMSASHTGLGTSVTNINGLSVTVTVPAGRRLRIKANVLFINAAGAANKVNVAIQEGATRLGFGEIGLTAANPGDSGNVIAEAIVSPSAGMHTYIATAQFYTGATNQAYRDPAYGQINFILVEDITGVSLGGLTDTTPIATVAMTAAVVAPNGWMLCDGTALSRTGFAALYALIGTTYGTGDGSTTFNLPNLKGRVPVGRDAAQTEFDVLGETGGAKTHTMSVAEMPSHLHTADGSIVINTYPTARAWNIPGGAGYQELNGPNYVNYTGGGGAHNNLQPYIAMNYIIKVM